MEARVIEYPRSSGLEYHHNSPLIGEIPANTDYSHFHRSIDQLRSLNERGILNTNHFQNVLVPSSTSPIVLQSASGVYSEIKLNDDYSQTVNKPTTTTMRRNGEELMENESAADEYQAKKDNVTGNHFRIIHSPQQYSITTSSISPVIVQNIHHQQQQQNNFDNTTSLDENQMKSKVCARMRFVNNLLRLTLFAPSSILLIERSLFSFGDLMKLSALEKASTIHPFSISLFAQDKPPTFSGLFRPLFYMQSIFLIKKILKFHSDEER